MTRRSVRLGPRTLLVTGQLGAVTKMTTRDLIEYPSSSNVEATNIFVHPSQFPSITLLAIIPEFILSTLCQCPRPPTASRHPGANQEHNPCPSLLRNPLHPRLPRHSGAVSCSLPVRFDTKPGPTIQACRLYHKPLETSQYISHGV